MPEIELPGDHFSPGGAYFVEDVTETPLVAKAGQFALGDGVSAGVAIDWPRFERMGRVVYQETFDLHNRGSRPA
jgi:hypothetical protein